MWKVEVDIVVLTAVLLALKSVHTAGDALKCREFGRSYNLICAYIMVLSMYKPCFAN